jgi:hypothetical protein
VHPLQIETTSISGNMDFKQLRKNKTQMICSVCVFADFKQLEKRLSSL